MGYQLLNSEKTELVNPYFSDSKQDYVYKAQITALKNRFGGILVVKKIAPQEHRVVFTTELGNTIFDFSFKKNEFVVNRIIKQMDKKLLLTILEKDFRALVKENLYSNKTYTNENQKIAAVEIDSKPYFYVFENEQLATISRIGNQKEKVVFEFSEINDDIAKQIKITHKNFNLKIELSAI